eukprot:CAMPEP_0119271870 /NCGR_PEP_ID=MMETSP1329-20130426/8284_1 /TAXON_ID=114041 /ORGANISM="Genus nov. species nov., Strain RCC1024" /LENGTH=145 /DNA_ID=CAMNT_0007271927 /DNA_START=148 /DNA_END=582 /DNA_ORIENTATION=+
MSQPWFSQKKVDAWCSRVGKKISPEKVRALFAVRPRKPARDLLRPSSSDSSALSPGLHGAERWRRTSDPAFRSWEAREKARRLSMNARARREYDSARNLQTWRPSSCGESSITGDGCRDSSSSRDTCCRSTLSASLTGPLLTLNS